MVTGGQQRSHCADQTTMLLLLLLLHCSSSCPSRRRSSSSSRKRWSTDRSRRGGRALLQLQQSQLGAVLISIFRM